MRIVRTRVTVNGQSSRLRAQDQAEPRTLNLSPVMPHLKALKKIQKEDRLKAGGAYAEDGYLVADALGRPCHPETLSGWFEGAGRSAVDCGVSRCTAAVSHVRDQHAQGGRTGSRRVVVPRSLHVQITFDVYGHVLPGQDRAGRRPRWSRSIPEERRTMVTEVVTNPPSSPDVTTARRRPLTCTVVVGLPGFEPGTS